MNLHKIKKSLLLLLLFFFIGCSDNTPPEQNALDLVKNSHIVNKDLSVDRVIKDFIGEKGDDIKPLCWRAEKMTDNRYLVSYKYSLHSFKEGVGERGFFFDVDLAENSVTDKIIGYIKKIHP